MSVWHIITCEYPPQIGGVSDHSRHLAEALARTGDEVHVWCPPAKDQTSSTVHVHHALGRFRLSDWRRVDRALDGMPTPPRLLVQWVPHGFGYHSMNPWICLWVIKRAWAGDQVELVVHEPFIEFRAWPLRRAVIALVHRVMMLALLQAASRVWLSTSAWERRLRRYTMGRRVQMAWLPVLTCRSPEYESPSRPSTAAGLVVGHFSGYGSAITRLLEERLQPILTDSAEPSILLLGAGSEILHAKLVARHPEYANRVRATGYVGETELGALLDTCDLLVQPYPDGITSRRTSALTCLARGRPVVSTDGHLTEALWRDTRAVELAGVDDVSGFVTAVSHLLHDQDARQKLGRRGKEHYLRHFTSERVVEVLRAA